MEGMSQSEVHAQALDGGEVRGDVSQEERPRRHG